MERDPHIEREHGWNRIPWHDAGTPFTRFLNIKFSLCNFSIQIKNLRDCWQHTIVSWFSVIPPAASHVMSHEDYCYYFVTQQTREGAGDTVTSSPRSLIRDCHFRITSEMAGEISRKVDPISDQIPFSLRKNFFLLIVTNSRGKITVYCNPGILLNCFWFAQKIWLMMN